MEEHLSRTWSKLLKTTERLNELEEVELDKEYMQRLLHRNNEEISDLRLEVENRGLRNDMVEMRRLYMKNQDEIDALRRRVQTMESKVEANEEKHPEKPKNLKSKNCTGKKMYDSKSPACKYVRDNFSA